MSSADLLDLANHLLLSLENELPGPSVDRDGFRRRAAAVERLDVGIGETRPQAPAFVVPLPIRRACLVAGRIAEPPSGITDATGEGASVTHDPGDRRSLSPNLLHGGFPPTPSFDPLHRNRRVVAKSYSRF